MYEKRASFFKRIGAGLFDLIVMAVITTLLVFVFNSALGYNVFFELYESDIIAVETQYGIRFDLSQEEFSSMSEEQINRYNEAYEALKAKTETTGNYNKLIKTTVISITLSLFITYAVWDFIIPILLKDGRTLGKKLFGIRLVSENGKSVSTFRLFVRTIIGKFAVETVFPVYMFIMFITDKASTVAFPAVFVLGLAQICVFFLGGKSRLLHDVFSGTLVVPSSF